MLNIKKLENTMSERNYSKAKLCSKIGITKTTLDAILNGSDAKISTIESIARVLNVNIGYLFDEESSAVASGYKNVAVPGNKTETINDRIEMLINQHFNGNKAAFAKTVGLPPTGLSNYLGKQRRSKPGLDMITKIITRLDVDARWLLIGEETNCSQDRLNADYSFGATATKALLLGKIKLLEALLTEKERMIQVLMDNRKS
ncbi:MAG: helix-turn-helix domain-containing protein [Muribaculaceae bacterium]